MRGPRGFTLIELMMTIAIMAMLASLALPRYGRLVLKSKEAAVKGQLGSLRSAISLYYSENEGVFPASAATLSAALTQRSRYLREIPGIQLPPPANHPHTALVTGTMGDNGRWFYTGAPLGHAAVCCRTHRTVDGTVWSRW